MFCETTLCTLCEFMFDLSSLVRSLLSTLLVSHHELLYLWNELWTSRFRTADRWRPTHGCFVYPFASVLVDAQRRWTLCFCRPLPHSCGEPDARKLSEITKSFTAPRTSGERGCWRCHTVHELCRTVGWIFLFLCKWQFPSIAQESFNRWHDGFLSTRPALFISQTLMSFGLSVF